MGTEQAPLQLWDSGCESWECPDFTIKLGLPARVEDKVVAVGKLLQFPIMKYTVKDYFVKVESH